ncbi:MAG: response regulator transcription factor [Chloroflexota bacterium]
MTKEPEIVVLDGTAFSTDSEVWQWLSTSSGTKSIPVLILAPERALQDWELNQEIDDFLIEPYRKAELVSRVRRLLRKAGKSSEGEAITRGALTVNSANYEVRVGERRVDLTYREYRLLEYLARNPGRVITRETLLNKVWGFDYFGGDRTVDVHIRRLRSKLEDAEHIFIDTVRNVGYRFREQ